MALPAFDYDSLKSEIDESKQLFVTILASLLKSYSEHTKEIRTGFDFEVVSKEFLVTLANVIQMTGGETENIREVNIFFYTGDDNNIGQIVPVKLGIPILMKCIEQGDMTDNLKKAIAPYIPKSSRVYFQADLTFADGNVILIYIFKKLEKDKMIDLFL